MKASEVLPKDLLRGENFVVAESVNNDGLFNVYEVDTDYGDLTVVSTSKLEVRVGELRALKIMEEMSRSEEFKTAAADAVKAPVKGAGQMVKAPAETTKGIFRGTGRFLSNVGRSVTSSDPHQANVLKTALGYDATKRGYAFELGIDPYTSYEPAAEALGQIAKASVAGGLTVAVGMDVATSGTTLGTVLTISSTAEGMRELSRDNPPGTLQKINTEKLERMGIDKKLVKAFIENYTYNPQEKTLLIAELDTMDGVADRDVFISIAHLATDYPTALFWRMVAQMMAGYHAHVAPVARVFNAAGFPMLQRKDGGVVAVGAEDHVFWTPELRDFFQEADATLVQMRGVKSKEYWLTGKVDPALRKYWSARGWKVTENANKRLIK